VASLLRRLRQKTAELGRAGTLGYVRRSMTMDRPTRRARPRFACSSTSGSRSSARLLARWREPDLGLGVRPDEPPGHVAIEHLDRHRGHHRRIEQTRVDAHALIAALAATVPAHDAAAG
jgi:hypothetical protein